MRPRRWSEVGGHLREVRPLAQEVGQLGVAPAVRATQEGTQGAHHQVRVGEANQEGEVQLAPRLQRPCVDDDPW